MHTSICSPFSLNFPFIPSTFISSYLCELNSFIAKKVLHVANSHLSNNVTSHTTSFHTHLTWHTSCYRDICTSIYRFYFVNLLNEMHLSVSHTYWNWDWILSNCMNCKCNQYRKKIYTSIHVLMNVRRMRNALEMYFMLKILPCVSSSLYIWTEREFICI